jgi:hypothetical protein
MSVPKDAQCYTLAKQMLGVACWKAAVDRECNTLLKHVTCSHHTPVDVMS